MWPFQTRLPGSAPHLAGFPRALLAKATAKVTYNSRMCQGAAFCGMGSTATYSGPAISIND